MTAAPPWWSPSDSRTPSASWRLRPWCCRPRPSFSLLQTHKTKLRRPLVLQTTSLSGGACDPLTVHIRFHNDNFLQPLTGGSDEVGAPERFPQLVLGLHGDHCIQIFCRLRREARGALPKIVTVSSTPSMIGENESSHTETSALGEALIQL